MNIHINKNFYPSKVINADNFTLWLGNPAQYITVKGIPHTALAIDTDFTNRFNSDSQDLDLIWIRLDTY